jgi:hypothetical protein
MLPTKFVWFKVSVRFGIINNTKNVRFGFSLSWFKDPCCVCQIWKILHYVILYCGRLLIFHRCFLPSFSSFSTLCKPCHWKFSDMIMILYKSLYNRSGCWKRCWRNIAFIDSAFRLIRSLTLSLSYHWRFLQIIACHLSFCQWV